jgi:hypothetical protein
MTSIALSHEDDADKMIGVLGQLVLRETAWNAQGIAPYFELARDSRYDARARGLMLQYLAQGGAPEVASVIVDYATEVVDELDTLTVSNTFFCAP